MKKLAIFFMTATVLSACEKQDGSGSSSDPSGTGQGGSLARFTIVGNHLYTVNGNNLKVFDISNGAHPDFKSDHDLNVTVETIFARDESTLFIGSTSGMFIYDISNAPALNYLSRYDHIVSCDPVVADNDYAYVTLRSETNSAACGRGVNLLEIINIQDLYTPKVINQITMAQPYGMALYGDTLLVCDDGIKVLNVANPLNPMQLSYIKDISGRDIIARGNHMIIATTTGFEQYLFKNGQLNYLSKI